MRFHELVEARRSVREYTDEPLDDETLTELFDRVKYTPTGYNLQPQEFLVLREDDRQALLRECAYNQEQVTDAAAAVVVLGNLDPAAHADRVFDDWLDKDYVPNEEVRDGLASNVEGWREQPAEENRVWTVRNSSLAAMTLIYAAWEMGIASCPMEGFDAEAVRDEFDIDDGYEPVMIVTLGYAEAEASSPSKPAKFRRPPAENVHEEVFVPHAE
ncbi:nitroreductase family protein [Natronobiforma cellulositropha]|uniref:nitroreductase family protein n=1 Tax=Natronobiforma cellulositropha TaxID=1679076 RepID=UPI0021D59872|nr:nitroreductase family protein [Natronobiforma cellulositropha]